MKRKKTFAFFAQSRKYKVGHINNPKPKLFKYRIKSKKLTIYISRDSQRILKSMEKLPKEIIKNHRSTNTPLVISRKSRIVYLDPFSLKEISSKISGSN